MTKVVRKRDYCFTLNNWTQEEYDSLVNINRKQVSYLVFGKEIGDKEETPHLQGYIRFYNAKTFEQTRKFFDNDRIHIEATKGTPSQNIAYCTKDEEYVEIGEQPKQGSRQDLKQVRDLIDSGTPLEDIILTTTSYQAARHAELIYKYKLLKQPKQQFRNVTWIQTKYVMKAIATAIKGEENYYLIQNDILYWDAYTGQKLIVISIDTDRIRTLLRLLSGLPFQLNVKGGIRWLQSTTTDITVVSRIHPLVFYDNEDSTELFGMINNIIDMT